MTLHQLRHVIRVASTGSISKAAKLLGISQPTLTNSMLETKKFLKNLFYNARDTI